MTTREKLTAYWTIVIKEFLRFIRIWPQTLVPPAITTGLYIIIFGGLIGPRIGPMDGFSYMEFIIPGLIMMSIITNAYANVVSSFYLSKYSHSIEEMLVSPLPNSIILAGYVSGGVARGLLVGAVVLIVSLLFSELHVHNLAVGITITLMTAILFSLAGFINAVYANSFDDISIIPTFVLTPLTYLGGIFYSISMLPEFWQNVSKLNPVLYMINAFRYAMLGVSDIPLYVSYLSIGAFIVILFGYALWLLNSGKGIRS